MAQAGRRGTAPSDTGFHYTARKTGKATWARGFRLTDAEYRANSVYLTSRLERHKGIKWDVPMRTSGNAQAIDEIIDNFKVRFPSFWDFITDETWVNWALRGMITTDARRIKKQNPTRGKHVGSKQDNDDDDGADDKSDVEPHIKGELTPSPSKRVPHGPSTEVTDDKQEVLQPPTGAHDAVTTETVVIFWAASDMNEVLHFCSVGDISRAKSTAEWKTEHLDYELYRKETKKVGDFDEATCWFGTIEKYVDYTTRMSIPVRNQQSLLLAAKILQKPPRHEEWNFVLVRNKAAIGQHDPTSVTQQPASVGRSGLTPATTKNVDDLETATRQMSIERREEAIARPSIKSGGKVPALNSNRAYEEEDDESDICPPRRNLHRSDHGIRRHAKRSISEVEESSESEDGDIDETLRKSNRTTNKHRPRPLRSRKHT